MALDCPQRGQGDPCVPSTHCPWQKHLPRCGGPLNLGFLLSLLLWLLLSLGWGSGMPRAVAWEGFHSHSPTTLCCRHFPWDSFLFFPRFSPFPLLLVKSLSHICSGRAGEGQPLPLDVVFLHSVCDSARRKSQRKAPSHHHLFIHHPLDPLCYPKHSCWA